MDEARIRTVEPIFELAGECESLFSEHVSRLKNENDLNGAKVVGEYQQRFAAWAAFLGVFAVPEMCLDRRLQRHVEIQDLVLRLLDIMKRNLVHLLETNETTFDGEDIEIQDSDRDSLPQIHISIESLRGIRGAVDRLNHLGGTIQRSSEAGQARKVGKFASGFDSTSFEEIARLAINSFYPDASPSLLEQLIRVMTDMYERFHYRRSRQVRLQARSRILLSTIDEESSSTAKEKKWMVPPSQTSPLVVDINKPFPRQMTMKHSQDRSQKSKDSKPTSLDSREFSKLFSQQNGGSMKSKTRSVLVNQVAYPQQLEKNLVCEWCFSPLLEVEVKGDNWRKHLNGDFRPFACISEKCDEQVKRFATSRAWFSHMLETHGQNWHREIHLPVWWVCPLCNNKDTTYSRAQSLSEHIAKMHDDVFSKPQIQVIVNQSQLRSPRPQDICPLCCLSMRDGQENGEEEQISEMTLPNLSPKIQQSGESHKRVKTETGPIQQTQHSDVNFGAEMEQAAPTTGNQASEKQRLLNSDAIASHVAAHLQGILLFTLRMMSLDVISESSSDDKTLSSSTDNDSSRASSNHHRSEHETNAISDLLEGQNDDMDLDDPSLEDVIPDCEHFIDWQDMIHNNEHLSGTDTFLQEVIRSGAFHYKESTGTTTRASIPPPRNPDFVGREEILSRIAKQCSEPASCVALVGMGGIGKSQLALEFAYQTAAKSAEVWVFWIHADTPKNIEEGFRRIASTVKLPGRELPWPDLFRLVYDWLSDERNDRWIIILDDVQDQQAPHKMRTNISKSLPVTIEVQPLAHIYLPPERRNSSIIITTRHKYLGYYLTGDYSSLIEIGPMPVVDAINIFKMGLRSNFLSASDMNAAVSLVKALGLIPLAISQAAVYINHRSLKVPFSKILNKLEESEEEVIELLEFDVGGMHQNGDIPNTILTIWQSSFDSIRSQRPSAADLLSRMSFFDRRGIPKWLLTSYKQDNNTPRTNSPSIIGRLELDNSDTNSDTDDTFNDDIEMLINHYLIAANRTRDIFEMRGIVQLSVRKSLSAFRLEQIDQQCIRRLATEFPTRAYNNWSICQELFAHVQEAAKDYPSNNALEEWATLLHNGGRYARLLGEFKVAKQMIDKASIAREETGGEDMKFFETLSLAALILMDQGQYDKAGELFTDVVNACKKAELGAVRSKTLISMNNLASIHRVQGRWKEAEELQVEVVETRKMRLGGDHPRTLTSAANLASIYRAQGRYMEAETLQMQVVESCKKALGQGHPQRLTNMSNLASLYRIQGKLDEAEELQMQAMNVREMNFGRNHPDTLSSMNSLASIFRAQGRLVEAENLQVQVVELRTRKLGRYHLTTVASINNLALIYNDQGECERAMELQSQVVEVCMIKLGPDHPHTLTSMNNLALIWKSQGQHEKFMMVMMDCSQTRERVLGPEHPYTLSSKAAVKRWST